MKNVKLFLKFIRYFFTAKSSDSIHSPFVFDLYTNLILDENPFYLFDKIEDLRLILENDNRKIIVSDFGSGRETPAGTQNPVRVKKIKSIAKKSATRAKYGQLLFRLVNKFQSETILEIGTSLGLGTLYLAAPISNSNVITLEGCSEISKIAKQNFEKLKIKNIQQVVGNFDETLPNVLENITPLSEREGLGVRFLDFIFFDGNHRKEPTLQYFEQCLKKSHSETVFVFDDIHWSHEMEEAWEEIKKNQQVKITIDLFFLGIVFFRKELTKQDFVLRF